MVGKIKVREILLYSEKITVSDVTNFFTQIMKSRLPLFGFLDFSDILSLNSVRFIIQRRLNTVRFFMREKKSLGELSMLIFPYKLSDPMELEKIGKGSGISIPKLYLLVGSQDFLSFMLKESVAEANISVIKIMGKLIGYGSAIDERGRKSILITTTPEKFLVVDMEKNPSVYIEVLEPIPKRMSLSSQYPVFEETGTTLGVDNYDVFQHTLVAGASGTGKSKVLFALVKAIEQKYGDGVRIVFIDPHGEFLRMFPNEKIVNLIDNYVEPLDVGGIKTPLMTQLIAQLLTSAIGQENKYSERVLFYAVHLLSSINQMDLRNVSLLLTDSAKRAEFLSGTDNDEVKRFFDEEFNDIYIHHFNDAILPVLNFVGEYELYLGGEKKKENLLNLIQTNRITVISFNPNFFGKRMINFLAGAIINQMYVLAITEKLHMPTILVVDEFHRVETRIMRDILAETRKFNLYAYISLQYLGQLSKEVHDSIVSNVRNIIAFKLNKQDATMISSIMEIKVEEYFKKARSQTEIEESKKEMFVRLHQRECMVRLYDGKKYILPMKLRVVDIAKYGYIQGMEANAWVDAPVPKALQKPVETVPEPHEPKPSEHGQMPLYPEPQGEIQTPSQLQEKQSHLQSKPMRTQQKEEKPPWEAEERGKSQGLAQKPRESPESQTPSKTEKPDDSEPPKGEPSFFSTLRPKSDKGAIGRKPLPKKPAKK